MSLAILFHFLCAQHVSDINISIIKSLQIFCWITTLVIQQNSCKLLMIDVLTLILLTWRIWWAPNNSNRWQMGFNSAFEGLMSETCWAHKKWNKISSEIKLVFYSSTTSYMFRCLLCHFKGDLCIVCSRTVCSLQCCYKGCAIEFKVCPVY